MSQQDNYVDHFESENQVKITYTAFTIIDSESGAEKLSQMCNRLSPSPKGVSIFSYANVFDLYEVTAYFSQNPDAVGLSLLANICCVKEFIIKKLPKTDWVVQVQQDLTPIMVGRFFIYDSHHKIDHIPSDSVALKITAGLAFGTGYHYTTQGCLKAIDYLVTQGFIAPRVLDIGCGTGILAMAVARVLFSKVIAVDIDTIAVDTAQKNIARNALQDRIQTVTCAGFNHMVVRKNAPYNLIMANILKGPLLALAADMMQFCQLAGYCILSGLLNTQADQVITVYQNYGFILRHHFMIKEWSILILQRYI